MMQKLLANAGLRLTIIALAGVLVGQLIPMAYFAWDANEVRKLEEVSTREIADLCDPRERVLKEPAVKSTKHTCDRCNGTGYMVTAQEVKGVMHISQVACPRCEATGATYTVMEQRAIVLVELDITDFVRHEDFKHMTPEEIKEFIQDSPEILHDQNCSLGKVYSGWKEWREFSQ